MKEKELVAPLYTAAGNNKEQKGVTKRYGGWRNDGIEKFNELLDLVRKDRMTNGAEFDNIISAKMKSSGAEDHGGEELNASNCIKADNDLVFDEEEEEEDEDYVVNETASV